LAGVLVSWLAGWWAGSLVGWVGWRSGGWMMGWYAVWLIGFLLVDYLLVRLLGSDNEAAHNELFLHHRIPFIYLPGHLRACEYVQSQLRNEVQKEQESCSIFTTMRENRGRAWIKKNSVD
jgi:hypothetical protein